jgi:hypothetical protein
MRHRYQVDPMTPRLRQISTVLVMLEDLNRLDQIIDSDIAGIEHKEPPAPIHAALTERRTKLRETIASLKTHLAYLRNSTPVWPTRR